MARTTAERREGNWKRAEGLREGAREIEQGVFKQLDMMAGTPILIGHHSENRHRNALARMDGRMAKARDLRQSAETQERTADSHFILSDDTDALDGLREKLAYVKDRHVAMKAANATCRKTGDWPEEVNRAVLESMGVRWPNY